MTLTKLSPQARLRQRGQEVQRYGALRLQPIALSAESRRVSAQLLNRVLADTTILYALYKNTTGSSLVPRSINCICYSTNTLLSSLASSTSLPSGCRPLAASPSATHGTPPSSPGSNGRPTEPRRFR